MWNLECEYTKIRELAKGYPSYLECQSVGHSLLGREIPLLRIGRGEKAVLYLGSHHGTDLLVGEALLAFSREVLDYASRGLSQYGRPVEEMLRERSIYVLPCPNPDGVAYVKGEARAENPLWERAERQNGGDDFSSWRANARGVDLSRNYAAGFRLSQGELSGAAQGFAGEYPESEPESAAIASFLRRERERLFGVLELSAGHGEILCSCEDNLSAKCQAVGRVLSRLTGLRQKRPENTPATGSLADYCVRGLCRPAFSLGVSSFCKEEEPLAAKAIFTGLRRALFCFPYLV